jgi:ADP-ribose pyrophosphatase YjhB (NUDIX family)
LIVSGAFALSDVPLLGAVAWENNKMNDVRTPDPGWFSDDEFDDVRRRLPMLYVEAVPVHVDDLGFVTDIGVLIRVDQYGEMRSALVAGRVKYGESIRDALVRNLEKDLGSLAFPRLPLSPVPATVAEYFPFPGRLVDERQHAVSLVYIVPVNGECQPRQDALDIRWIPFHEALLEAIDSEFVGGRGQVLRAALNTVTQR